MPDLTGTIGVVIADDHEMVRAGLTRLFDTIHRAIVIGVAADGLEAIALCRKHRPGLLTLDVGMPLANGAEVFAECRRWSPETRVAVFTGFTSVVMLADWIASGVDGLFLKTCGEEELRRGLEIILSGQKYVATDVMALLEDAPPPPDLTPREREVLALIAAGLTSSQIGGKLAISPKTVEKHRATLFEKFGATSVAALLTAAFRTGLLDHFRQT
ncbi:MAG: response regulator transcription factor [Hyphomonas sp.]|nr:response regulator transcription factor [Hyphomonas sp.]